MRYLTLALLCGAYACLALTAGLVGWRLGGTGLSVALAAGALALFLSIQELAARLQGEAHLSSALAELRAARRNIGEEVEKARAYAADAARAAGETALKRSEEIYSEVQLLEDVVQRLGERLQSELSLKAAKAAVLASPRETALIQTVRQALEAGRVDLYLQAVVSLPQRRTQFYESFTRLRDESGRVLMPAEFLSVAEPGGLVAAIDNLLLFRCVQIVRRLAGQERRVGIFCNVSLASLSDAEFFPQFLEFLSANRDLAGALVFELGQAAFDARGAAHARNMAKLADLGFRFSIDKVTSLALNFQDLARADVAFVKIGAPLLLGELEETASGMRLKSLPDMEAVDFASLARRHGVQLVAEKIESERQVIDVLELDIGYGQGTSSASRARSASRCWRAPSPRPN
jgi:cyclic-di-GMP phosphodiesterase TipF (flagellum assembly factor)